MESGIWAVPENEGLFEESYARMAILIDKASKVEIEKVLNPREWTPVEHARMMRESREIFWTGNKHPDEKRPGI